MIQPGKFNLLTVTEELKHGFYLHADSGEQVFLPREGATRIPEIGDRINLFVYTENKYGLIATFAVPYVTLGEFAVLEVEQSGRGGALLNWGIESPILLPPSEQIKALEPGDTCLVYIYADDLSGRLTATTKFERFLDRKEITSEPGAVCELVVWKKFMNDVRVVVDQQYEGIVLAENVDKKLKVGDQLTGFIHYIRPDGKIEIAVKETGKESVDNAISTIMKEIKRNSGFLNLSGSSEARKIKADLNISKSMFNQAVNMLQKEDQIVVEDKGIRLVAA